MGMPLREYYPITRAASLLGYETNDLLHWASTGSIRLFINFDVTNLTEGYVVFTDEGLSLRTKFIEKGIASDSFSRVYNLKNIRDINYPDPKINYDGSELILKDALECGFSGFWQLPKTFFGLTELYDIHPQFFQVWMSVSNKMIVNFNSEEPIDFDLDDIYVMKNDFIMLRDSRDGESLPSFYNGGVLPPDTEVSTAALNPGRAEHHAKKREEVLKAAIYIKHCHPELCDNYTNWANAISDHAHKFWNSGEAPLSIKTIAALIGEAHRLPTPSS